MTASSPVRWYARYPRVALAVFASAGIMLVLLLAELVSRGLFPQWAPVTAERATFWQFDSLLGWSQVPGHEGRFHHPDFDIDVRINALGMRDSDYALPRNARKRMLVLGDSYGWGFGVNQAERFSELLEARHPEWEILNASVSGYGTVQEYLYLRERGLALKPDVVLLLFFDNDFQDNLGNTEYWYAKPVVTKQAGGFVIDETPLSPPSLWQGINIALMGHSYLVRGIYGALAGGSSNATTDTDGSNAVTGKEALDATVYVMSRLMQLAQEEHFQLLVAETPLSAVKHAALQQSCDAYRVPCLHLNTVFRRNTRDWHFEHDRHWNAKGHRMAADALDVWLQEQGVWDFAAARQP